MKGYITYIKGHKESEVQAQQSLKSFKKYNWNVELEGITKRTVENTEEYSMKIIEQSRLHNFKTENYNKFLTKLSCAINHIQFWKEVVEKNEPMYFFEHDSLCTQTEDSYNFEDYLILNAEFVFRPPNKLGLQQFKNFAWPSFGVCDLPESYPLTYHKNNIWKDSMMVPGTAAYAITPTGAQKMLDSVEKSGLDQSDFMLNSFNLRIRYINPSPVKFNAVNLSTSYGF